MTELESKVVKNLDAIKAGRIISRKELITWLKQIYSLLDFENVSSYNLSLACICYVADSNPTDPMVRAILNEIIIKSRIFLYRDMLEKRNEGFLIQNPLNDIAQLSRLFYRDPVSGVILTKPQREVLAIFSRNKRLILSAPTSFGKTKILEEIITNNNYKHIAIIVPTNALLAENSHRLKAHELISHKYKIIYSSKISPSLNLDQNLIFVLTPEKLLNLLDEHKIIFDFFVFDEFYKISKDFESDEKGDYDRRYKIFQYSLYTLVQNINADFYMLGPYIDGFSQNFLKKENAVFKEYNTEIVQKRIFTSKSIAKYLGIKLSSDKKKSLFKILDRLRAKSQQNLVYVPRQEVAENLSQAYAMISDKPTHSLLKIPSVASFIKYIEENISPEWDLVSALKKGIAFHHGGIPRYIQTQIVALFNKEIIHSLICTTTLAEGVNTTAKNVIIYDTKKSQTALTTFDRKNIEGRSGRFAEHFIGNVFYLENPKDDGRKTSVEFELYDSQKLTQEDLILLHDKDLSKDNLQGKEQVLNKLRSANIPHFLIKKNRFINVNKQIDLIEFLRNESQLPFEQVPNNSLFIHNKDYFEQLILNIFKLTNTDLRGAWNGYTAKQMSWLAFSYIRKPHFKTILNHKIVKGYSENINTRIRKSLKILSQHFEFLVPRYMQAFEAIYNFVANERNSKTIELGYIVNLLEYGTSDKVELLLRDAGLPLDIVRKIKKYFDGCEDIGAIITRKRRLEAMFKNMLNEFEIELLNRYL